MKSRLKAFEEGFTLPEVVIAVFILSLGSYLLFMGGHRLFNNFVQLRQTNIFLSEATQCNALIDAELNNIRFPYWETLPEFSDEADSVTIPFLYGIKEKVLTLAFTDTGFIVSSGDEKSITYQSLMSGYIKTIKKEDHVAGINVVLTHNKKEYECASLFGGIPLFAGGNNDE